MLPFVRQISTTVIAFVCVLLYYILVNFIENYNRYLPCLWAELLSNDPMTTNGNMTKPYQPILPQVVYNAC